MKIYKLNILILLLTISATLSAQFKAGAFFSLGVNPVEQPVFVSSGIYASAKYKFISADYAFDLNINNRDIRAFNAIKTSLNYETDINNSHLKAGILYLYKPSTELISEQNIAIQIDYLIKKWELRLGNNFRAYKFKKATENTVNTENKTIIWEKPNIMYMLRYYFLEPNKDWNFYMSVTNFDWFIIEQEVNPFINAGGYYKNNKNGLKLFMDLNYQAAGFNNIRVNYFGFFIRTGFIWEIDLKVLVTKQQIQ
ncbi:MAG: hypothetical protein PHE33_12890, partial [Bacteroidales bacterium]|nr:hypothetical protein [Bacteroidales bacterium]